MNSTRLVLFFVAVPSFAMSMQWFVGDSGRHHREFEQAAFARAWDAASRGTLDFVPAFMPLLRMPKTVAQCREFARKIEQATLVHTIKVGHVFELVPCAGMVALAHAVARVPRLQQLTLPIQKFGVLEHERQQAMVYMLAHTRQLASLDVHGLGDAGYGMDPHIAQYQMLFDVIGNKPLTRLVMCYSRLLFHNEVARRGVVAMLQCMTHTLVDLDLSGNLLCILDVDFWVQMNPVFRRLKKLSLENNFWPKFPMSDDAWRACANALSMSDIEDLNMSLNDLSQLSDEAWHIFTSMLARMPYLKRIDVCATHLNCLPVSRRNLLVDALVRNSNHPTMVMFDDEDLEGFWVKQRDIRGLAVTIEHAEYIR